MIAAALSFFSGIWGKVAGIGAILLAIIIALLMFGSSQREAGRDEIRVEEAERVEKARSQWDEHANERPDFESAIGRLRERSGRPSGVPATP